MELFKAVSVGDRTFKPGQEAELIALATAKPESVDFIRLRDLAVIDEVPFVEEITDEERERRVQKIADDEAEKIRLANERAVAEQEKIAADIKEAHERAAARKESSQPVE